MIPQGMSLAFTPSCINSSTKWLHAIDNFNRFEDHQYSAGRNSSCAMAWLLKSRVTTGLKKLSSSLWKWLFILKSNLIARVFLQIIVVPSPCSASSSNIWWFKTKRCGMILKNILRHLIFVTSQVRMSLLLATSWRPSSMFLETRPLPMLSVPSLKGLRMHPLQTSLMSTRVRLPCAVTVSMLHYVLQFLFEPNSALCWTI